jgi:tetratricopeptide (TPR) repeat protein
LAFGYWADAARYAGAVVSLQISSGLPDDEQSRESWILVQFVQIISLWLQGRPDTANEILNDILISDFVSKDEAICGVLELLLGLMATAEGRKDEAIALYRRGVERVHALNHSPTITFALDLLARALISHGLYTEAIDVYQEKLHMTRPAPDVESLIDTLQGLAAIALGNGLPDLQRSCLEESTNLALSHKPGVPQPDKYLSLAFVASQDGDYKRAAELYRTALNQARLLENRQSTAEILRNLAFVDEELGKDVRSLLEESLALSRQIGDSPGITRSLIQLGGYHYDKENADIAQDYYQQATRIASRNNNPALEALAWEGLGDLAFDCGEWGEAGHLYTRSSKLHESGGQIKGQARTLYRLGCTLAASGQSAEAFTATQASMVINKGMGDFDEYAAGLCMLARIRADEGRFEEARKFGQEAVNILKKIGSEHSIIATAQLKNILHSR